MVTVGTVVADTAMVVDVAPIARALEARRS